MFIVISCVRIYAILRSELKKHFGDFSFTSFVKMITQEGKRVNHVNVVGDYSLSHFILISHGIVHFLRDLESHKN